MDKIMIWDILVIAGLLMYMGAGFCTNWLLTTTREEVGQAALQLEGDPFARQLMNIKYGLVITMVLGICLLGGTYVVTRIQYKKTPSEVNYLMVALVSMTIMLFFAHNLLNDLPIFLKLWVGG